MNQLYAIPAVLLGALLCSAPAAAQNAEAKNGVVPAAQATKGESVFKVRCLECHASSDFTKLDFARAWDDKPLIELWSQILKTMPDDKPGTLPPDEVLDVVLYIYKLNGAPEGEGEIKADESVLKTIKLKMKLEGSGQKKPLRR